MYLYDGAANQTGLTVASSAASGNAAQIVTTNASGIAGFKTSPVLAEFNNGMSVAGYSGNELGQTWSVSSADGSAGFGNTSITGKLDVGTSVAVNDSAASVYGVGLNAGGLPGISFNATGATKKFGIFGGSPGNSNGTLQFWDWTAGQSILNYDGTTWNAPKPVSVTGRVTATAGFQNNGGATWTTGTGNPAGGCTTGSMYSRTDATSNAAALFVCVNTAWAAAGGGGGGGSKWSGTSYPAYSLVASGTRYFAFGSSSNYSSAANVAPGWAGTLSNFCVYVASTQPASGPLTLTAFWNGSATALTVSVAPGTNGVQCDTTHSVTVAATDLITIQAVNGSTSGSGVVQSVTAVIQ